MLGVKTEYVSGDWIKPHNEKFRNLYSSPDNFLSGDNIKDSKMDGVRSTQREEVNNNNDNNMYRPWSTWQDNVKMGLN